MNRQTRMLLSFFALVGFAILLLADDAGPECSGVNPFAVTLTYATNCDTSDKSTHTGTIEFDIPSTEDASLSSWRDQIVEQAKAGGLEAQDVVVNESCSEDGQPAYVQSLSFYFSGSVVCSPVSITESTSVECRVSYNDPEGEPACELQIDVEE